MKIVENPSHPIALFKGKSIRKTIFRKEWWFSILDIIQAITDSPQPKTYWAKMKERDNSLYEPFPFWEQLNLSPKTKSLTSVFTEGRKMNTKNPSRLAGRAGDKTNPQFF